MQTRSKSRIDYQAIAEFRFEIRRFLHSSERIARAAGLEPQQHQALLVIKGLPAHRTATVGVLAERLLVQHHSAVELANRLEAKGLLRRARGAGDRRSVLLGVTGRGEKLLKRLALAHRAELKTASSKLLQALLNLASRERRSGQLQVAASRGRSSVSRRVKQKHVRSRK